MSIEIGSMKKDTLLKGHTGIYRIVKPLGLAGATAEVFLTVREQDGEHFAFKIMHSGLSPEIEKRFKDEMADLQELRGIEDKFGTHHIPRIEECSDLQYAETQSLMKALGKRPFMFMNFAEGINVATLLRDKGPRPESEALEIAKQFSEVLHVIHTKGYTYKDMKLENLIWDTIKRHLMVIDWNVVAKDRLEIDAPKDRLRAATYLYRMITNCPIELKYDKESKLQVADQSYRKTDEFKKLTVGTQNFLLKAFHPNMSSRHGKGGPQVVCTREFYEELKRHSERLVMPWQELFIRGESAIDDRQYQAALEDLDVVENVSYSDLNQDQYVYLQEMQDRARKEVEKSGRNVFQSGLGRYNSNLFREAKDDFEQALKDDPYDEEARHYAILTDLADRLKEKKRFQDFQEIKSILEYAINKLMEGHLEVAENTLKQLPPWAFKEPEVISLQAEIEVRKALKEGKHLLNVDKLEEAEKCFKSVYQNRDKILRIQLLEKNLGDLRESYELVEQLKELNIKGDKFFEQGKFHDAAREFCKVRTISPDITTAYKKYQKASIFSDILKQLELGNPERALEKCDSASSSYQGELALNILKSQVITSFCEKLCNLADRAIERKELLAAQEYLQEALKIKPDDNTAKNRLDEIQKDIYNEIDNLEREFLLNPSIDSCEKAIQCVKEKGYESIEKGTQLINRAKKLHNDILLLSSKLNEYSVEGKMKELLSLLAKAEADRLTLPEGNPADLRKKLLENRLETQLEQARVHVRSGEPKEALHICQKLITSQISEETKHSLKELIDKANRLIEIRKYYNEAEKKLNKLKKEKRSTEFESLKLQWELLSCKRQELGIRSITDESELSCEYRNKLKSLQPSTRSFMDSLRSEVRTATDTENRINSLKKMNEVGSILVDFGGEVGEEGQKWQSWYIEFNGLHQWLEEEMPNLYQRGVSVILNNLAGLVQDDSLKKSISELRTDAENSIENIRDKLNDIQSNLRVKSPIVSWLSRYLEVEVIKDDFWKKLSYNIYSAKKLFEQYLSDEECRDALETVKRIDEFLMNRKLKRNILNLSYDQLEQIFDEAKNLCEDIQKFTRLEGSDYKVRLDDQLMNLQKAIDEKKKVLIKEYSDQIEGAFDELRKTEKDYEKLLYLEDIAKVNITELRRLDQLKADKFEKRLTAITETITKSLQKKITVYEKYKRLTELQRRIIEGEISEDEAECLEDFKDHLPSYRKMRSIVEYETKRILKVNMTNALQKLLHLREEYGEFPELNEAIKQQREELYREEAERQLTELQEKYEDKSLIDNTESVRNSLEKIQLKYLADSMKETYLKIEEDIKKILLLQSELTGEEFEEYLKNDKKENRINQWLDTLDWAIKTGYDKRILLNNFNIKKNLEKFMEIQLGRRKSNIENVILFLWLDNLKTKSRTINQSSRLRQ